jgi:glycosylphosphatidylinositol transamidase (GPIT) subunit GPI8
MSKELNTMLHMKRLFSVLLLLAASAALTLPLVAAAPNIIVIMADDLGYGDLSSYGAKDLQSPHIDTLVQRGLNFTNFYAIAGVN